MTTDQPNLSEQVHENLKTRLGDWYLKLPADEKVRLRREERDRLLQRGPAFQICTDCLQEFPEGRGYAEHECPGRPARAETLPAAVRVRVHAENQASKASPWATDALLQIIDVLWGELFVDQVTALEVHSPEIAQACQVIHNLLNHTGFPKLTDNDPVKLASCAPECRFLETRQHTPDCKPTSVL